MHAINCTVVWPMTEDEIMKRAREAVIVTGATNDPALLRRGGADSRLVVKVAAQALRDASKPLDEILPPDPDETEARRVASALGATTNGQLYEAILAAIKRGRELERGE